MSDQCGFVMKKFTSSPLLTSLPIPEYIIPITITIHPFDQTQARLGKARGGNSKSQHTEDLVHTVYRDN